MGVAELIVHLQATNMSWMELFGYSLQEFQVTRPTPLEYISQVIQDTSHFPYKAENDRKSLQRTLQLYFTQMRMLSSQLFSVGYIKIDSCRLILLRLYLRN